MPRSETTVLLLNRLTQPASADDRAALAVETILSAIESGCTLDGQKPPKMRYHEESGLLFLSGTREQVSLAERVLKLLERDRLTNRGRPSTPRGKAGVEKAEGGGDR